MTPDQLSRRLVLQSLGCGALLVAFAYAAAKMRRVTVAASAGSTPSAAPSTTITPLVTSTPEPSATPEPTYTSVPTSTSVPTNAPDPVSTAQEASLPQPPGRPSRVMGLYLPYTYLESPIDFEWLEAVMLGTGANCAVIDIKAEGGKIAVPFEHWLRPAYTNNAGFDYEQVGTLVNWLVEHNYYPVARHVVMSDTPLARAHEELAYHFHSPRPYIDSSGEIWVNPERSEVGEYNAVIAVAAAQMGFREVQLDYIRYPEANFGLTIERRVSAIAGILATIRSSLGQQALLTIDVLGDSTRSYPDDMADGGYGQHIATLAQNVDGICPMLYPDLRQQNLDVDYHQFVLDGTARTVEQVASVGATAFVNPWIQAYGAAGLIRIRQQVNGAFQAGAVGVCAWNRFLSYPDGMYT